MQKGEETIFEELFKYSCPKFVLQNIPEYENIKDSAGQVIYYTIWYDDLHCTPLIYNEKKNAYLTDLNNFKYKLLT